MQDWRQYWQSRECYNSSTYAMGGVVKHLDGLDSVGLQGTVENEETGKLEITFDVFSIELVDLESQV